MTEQIVIVTGGTGALGESVCRTFLARGCVVHATHLLDHEVQGFDERMREHQSRYQLHRADVTNEEAVQHCFAAVMAASGRIDVVVNVAGGFAMGPIESTTLATWNAQLGLNLTSVFLSSREAMRAMRPHNYGRIVNIGSRAAVDLPGGMSAYVASKAGVLALTQALAAECKGTGITVNAVMPSTIDTAANRASMPDADWKTWVKPEEIARVCYFLASDEARVTSGALIPVYGDA